MESKTKKRFPSFNKKKKVTLSSRDFQVALSEAREADKNKGMYIIPIPSKGE